MLIQDATIRDAEEFRRVIPGLLMKHKIPGEEIPDLWALREYALRVGTEPAGLFAAVLSKSDRWNRASQSDWKAADRDRLGKEPEPEEPKEKPLKLQAIRPLTAAEMDAKMRRLRNYDPVPKSEQKMTLAEYLELERGTKALAENPLAQNRAAYEEIADKTLGEGEENS